MSARVLKLHKVEGGCGNVVGQLRQLADSIEADEFGEVTQMVVCFSAQDIEIRSYGRCDAGGVMFLMELAKHKLLGAVVAEMEN